MPRLRLVPLLPLVLACALDLPPSGRHLWWRVDDPEDPELAGLSLDPDTGAFLGLDGPIAIPRGASELYVMPDGERLVVLDELEDRLLLLE